jgi:hypothetical protein
MVGNTRGFLAAQLHQGLAMSVTCDNSGSGPGAKPSLPKGAL